MLQLDNRLLESIHQQFILMVRELRERGRLFEIICFFEELPLSHLVGQVVSRDEAAIEGYPLISIHRNHRDMVKFNSEEDTGFSRLAAELVRLNDAAMERCTESDPGPKGIDPHETTSTRTIHSTFPYYSVPLRRNRHFVGRNEVLENLRQMLFLQRTCRRAALTGLGGVGKTQIALEFVHWVKEAFPEYSILWVVAISDESLEQSFADIARHIPVNDGDHSKSMREMVLKYLDSDEAGPWLIVIDNADDMETIFRPSTHATCTGATSLLPENDSGLALVTTRFRDVAFAFAGVDIIEICEMSPTEAMSLLENSLCQPELVRNGPDTPELLEELTLLPLAITQAAAYIDRNQISASEYLCLLRDKDLSLMSLMSREFRDTTRYSMSRNAVAATWSISFEKIQNTDPFAGDILAFVSQIESKAIPRSMFQGLGGLEQLASAIGTLCAYRFLTRRHDDMYDMHSLVHLATRLWIDNRGLTLATTGKALKQLVAVFPPPDYANRATWRNYLPHAFSVLQSQGEIRCRESCNLFASLGGCLGVDGRTDGAVNCWEQVHDWTERNLAEDDKFRIASQSSLAKAYRADGQVPNAVALLEQVLSTRSRLLPGDHAELLSAQHTLAIALRADGSTRRATKLLEHVVSVRNKTLQRDHPDRLAVQHTLARAYEAEGRIQEATEMLEEVLELRNQTLAEDNPDRLATEHVLGGIYSLNGQATRGILLLEHAVDIRLRTLHEDHPDLLATQHTLAKGYINVGRTGQAISLLENIVSRRRRTLTVTHPNRLASEHTLGRAYHADGQIKKGINILKHVVLLREQTLSGEHPSLLESRDALALARESERKTD